MKVLRVDRPIRLFAPAKINLGLEIIGRRDDGYHEIVTILQTVSLFDVIELRPADRFTFAGDPTVESGQDLGLRAIRTFEERLGTQLLARVRVEKHIPIAAGLGGGSSDAGTLLSALSTLAGTGPDLALNLAAELGSDVPFFVHGGTALATGTGTELTPLACLTRMWFVIVTPRVEIANKTARLYGDLRADDFTDGTSTREVARSIDSGEPFQVSLLRNAFSRPLYDIPEIERNRKYMLDLGATFALPCGAGPSLFTACHNWQTARDLASKLRDTGVQAVACTSIGRDLNRGRLA